MAQPPASSFTAQPDPAVDRLRRELQTFAAGVRRTIELLNDELDAARVILASLQAQINDLDDRVTALEP